MTAITTPGMESDVANAKTAGKDKKNKKDKKGKKGKKAFTAATADRHVLYQLSVQNVEAEIDFVDQTYKELRAKHAIRLREDFCGTGHTSAYSEVKALRNRASFSLW